MKNQQRKPSDEEIGALATGDLQGEERRRLIERLNQDPESYQLYLETVQLLEAAEEEHSSAPLRPEVRDHMVASQREPSRNAWIAIAAALLVLVLGIVAYRALYQGSVDPLETQWAAKLFQGGAAASLTWSERPPGGFSAAVSPETSAFRLGRAAMDASLAASAGEREILSRHLREIANHLDSLGHKLESRQAFSSAATDPDMERAKQLLRDQFEDRLPANLEAERRFGSGIESGRLAAASGQGDFFQETTWREEFDAWHGRTDLAPPVRREMDTVEAVLAKEVLAERDLEDLHAAFAEIIRLR